MEHLIHVIALWLSVNFGLDEMRMVPRIEFVSAAELEMLHSGKFVTSDARGQIAGPPLAGQRRASRKVLAVYHDAKRTIFLTEGWSATSPSNVSILVHELVHHFQVKEGMSYRCPQAREKLAYDAQEAWLGMFGTSLEEQFGIDAMTLLISTKCYH